MSDFRPYDIGYKGEFSLTRLPYFVIYVRCVVCFVCTLMCVWTRWNDSVGVCVESEITGKLDKKYI